jgi:hypothetical protein
MSAGAAGGAAAAAAAIAEATKASGVIVRIEPNDFEWIVRHNPEPLVVHAPARAGFLMLSFTNAYLTSYRGLAFYTTSDVPLSFGADCQIVEAQKIWIPG